MIEMINVSKGYKTRSGERVVLNEISLTVKPGDRVGILGRNGSGKSTLIRILGGVESQDSGRIIRSMSISWPLALTGGLQHTLSGLDNLKFICRVYNKDYKNKKEFIQEFTELGRYLYEPVAFYSSGMRAKLGLGISLILDFDCYLVDEALSVGDKRLQEKYQHLMEQRKTKSLIFVSHNERQIEKNCQIAYVLDKGSLLNFESVNQAIMYYKSLKSESQMELGKA